MIVVTEDGITTFDNESHPKNALLPIYEAVGGIFISVNDLQFLNVPSSIPLMVDGISTDFNCVQFLNEHGPIFIFGFDIKR